MICKKYKIELLDTFSKCKEVKVKTLTSVQYNELKKFKKEKSIFQYFSKVQKIAYNYQIVSIKEI